MPGSVRTLITVAVAASVGALLATWALPVAGQTAAYRAPRLADGHPDLNGIWQALNEANYDIEIRGRRWPCGPVRTGRCLRRPSWRSARLALSPQASVSWRGRFRTARRRWRGRSRTRKTG